MISYSRNTLSSIKVKKTSIYISIYLFLAFLLFIFFAKDDISRATEGVSNLRTWGIYADHPTYVNYFIDLESEKWIFLLLKPNFLGPFVTLYIVGTSVTSIFLFNVFILILSIRIIFNYISIRKNIYLLLLLINPVTLVSLFSVNKEIYTLLSVNIFIIYCYNKKMLFFVVAVFLGIFARKELSLLFIGYCLIELFYKNFFNSISLVSFLLVVILTIGGFVIDQIFSSIDQYAVEIESTVLNSGSGGTILVLNNVQKHYGYIWVFIPKTFLNLVGSVFSRTHNFFYFDHIYNDIVVWIQSLLFIPIIFVSLAYHNNTQDIMNKKLLFLFIISCVLFSYIPVVQNRYFYGGYLLLITMISYQPKNCSSNISLNQTVFKLGFRKT